MLRTFKWHYPQSVITNGSETSYSPVCHLLAQLWNNRKLFDLCHWLLAQHSCTVGIFLVIRKGPR